jgi:hypothetical protein
MSSAQAPDDAIAQATFMERSMTPMKQLFAGLTLLAICMTALVAPTPTHAASGGGCVNGGGSDKHRIVNVASCISAPRRGVGRPDMYISALAGHTDCFILIWAAELRSGRYYRLPETLREYRCPHPSYSILNAHYLGVEFTRSSGTFRTQVEIRFPNRDSIFVASQALNLP